MVLEILPNDLVSQCLGYFIVSDHRASQLVNQRVKYQSAKTIRLQNKYDAHIVRAIMEYVLSIRQSLLGISEAIYNFVRNCGRVSPFSCVPIISVSDRGIKRRRLS